MALAVSDPNAAKLRPLLEFLSMRHPKAPAPGAPKPASGIYVSIEGTPEDLSYYTQARGFADFMIARSGNGYIFAAIAEAIAAGMTFESWLAQNGAAANLPPTLPSLEGAWTQWLHAVK
jgi:hypothetical protein